MRRRRLERALIGAIEELFARDRPLLDVNVHENTIAAMLKCCLQPKVGRVPEDGAPWDVDVDYNRRQAMVKTINGVQNVRSDQKSDRLYFSPTDFIPNQNLAQNSDSFSAEALILWIERSAPLYSCS